MLLGWENFILLLRKKTIHVCLLWREHKMLPCVKLLFCFDKFYCMSTYIRVDNFYLKLLWLSLEKL
jgi:hypothetical protein